MQHETLVVIAKTFGLFYMIALSIVVVIYACRPSAKRQFQRAAESILQDPEDRPCP